MFEKEVYEAPSIEVTEFELEEAISVSLNDPLGIGGLGEDW